MRRLRTHRTRRRQRSHQHPPGWNGPAPHRNSGISAKKPPPSGGGEFTAETRDNEATHACVGLDNDIETFTTAKGIFANGITDTTVEAVLSDLRTVEFVCVWDYFDSDGFGGNQTVTGRNINPDGSEGMWCHLDDTFLKYLTGDPTASLDDVSGFVNDDAPAAGDLLAAISNR